MVGVKIRSNFEPWVNLFLKFGQIWQILGQDGSVKYDPI